MMLFGHCAKPSFQASWTQGNIHTAGNAGHVKTKLHLLKAVLLLAGGIVSTGTISFAQDSPSPATPPDELAVPAAMPRQTSGPLADAQAAAVEITQPLSPAVETLLSFQPSDAKFDVDALMDILRDKRHEGWVLAAYPDPKTAQPLIGAGFSLDLPAREHLQRDPLNPHPFLEPSSAELWQAAGLPPAKLQAILAEFHDRLDALSKKGFRRQIWNLEPQITNNDADALLRIGIIQSIDNAKAYCRNFDRLSASQQMAMTQLVYQMGVNLEEFSTFLDLINHGADTLAEAAAATAKADAAYWRSVQMSLVQSQWARLYRARATAVIAMLDPAYSINPSGAEHSIGAILHPARVRRGHATVRSATYTHRRASASKRRTARTRKE